MSIGHFELDFDEFPDTLCIVGHNGAGKTSVSEALYWCMTGDTTKSLDNVGDVVNWYAGWFY